MNNTSKSLILVVSFVLILSAPVLAVIFCDPSFGYDTGSHSQYMTNCFDELSSEEFVMIGNCHGLHQVKFEYRPDEVGMNSYYHTCGTDLPQETTYQYFHFWLPDHSCNVTPEYTRILCVFYRTGGSYEGNIDERIEDAMPICHP